MLLTSNAEFIKYGYLKGKIVLRMTVEAVFPILCYMLSTALFNIKIQIRNCLIKSHINLGMKCKRQVSFGQDK